MSALDDRRQSAREAFHDARNEAAVEPVHYGLEEAIETATRVNISDDMIEQAMMDTCHDGAGPSAAKVRRLLVDAFRAAGFEVER
ncbi:MAG: hypothetical protein ABW022_17745 [Actinoplanes sp.]